MIFVQIVFPRENPLHSLTKSDERAKINYNENYNPTGNCENLIAAELYEFHAANKFSSTTPPQNAGGAVSICSPRKLYNAAAAVAAGSCNTEV